MRAVVAIAAVLAAALGAVVFASTRGDGPGGEPPQADTAHGAAERFLDAYVDEDGRVVRHDQGGSTVSEGQAYAMLLSAAIGDRARFDAAWGWARDNLRRSDGLLSSLWEDGRIADPQPAADADLDAARALLVAADRFGEPAYERDGLALGDAILRHETAVSEGRPLLLPGPWAAGDEPWWNPSYFDPRAVDALTRAGGDARWPALAEGSRDLLAELTQQPPSLPPDWARIASGTAVASPPPADPAAPPVYGYDAVRVPVRLAASCSPGDRALAAGSWPLLSGTGEEPPAQLSLDGAPASDTRHAAGLVGAAAAAGAAGDVARQADLLGRASALAESSPTYYGDAWVALGRVMLTTDWLGSC